MSKATFIPAVTETRQVVLERAKVVIEFTPEDAGKLMAILANTNGEDLMDVFMDLYVMSRDSAIPRFYLPDTPIFHISNGFKEQQ